MGRRKTSKTARKAKSKWSLQTFESMADADKADREYWWSRSPAQRMRELERLRQLNWGYGKGKPTPRLQRIIRVTELGGGYNW
jgi:hypothetical protein